MYTNKQQTAQQIELVEAMNAITVLLLAITGTLALEIDYRNCGMARISKLELLGCSPKSIGRKCTVRRGETITLDAEFTPLYAHKNVHSQLIVRVGFLELKNFPFIDYDACRQYVKCPISKSNTAIKANFTVPAMAPKFLNPLVTAQLTGDNDGVVACAQFKVALE